MPRPGRLARPEQGPAELVGLKAHVHQVVNNLDVAATTVIGELTLLFEWGRGEGECFSLVLRRLEHVIVCSVFFNVLNIEHVAIFLFHVQNSDFMFVHVRSCSACSKHDWRMFTKSEHAKHEKCPCYSFHVQSCSACSMHVLCMFDKKTNMLEHAEHAQNTS